jgi:choline dehydrogenase
VEVTRRGDDGVISARREVILACGAIGSPQLLLLSGVGDVSELSKWQISPVLNLPGVGNNLQEHLTVRTMFRVSGAVTLNSQFSSLRGRLAMGLKYAFLRSGPLTMPPATVNAYIRSGVDQETPDIQLLAFPLTYDTAGDPPHKFPGFSVNVVLLRPASRGTVRLRSSDPNMPPAIHFNMMSNSLDRDPIVAGIKRVREICSAPSLHRFRPTEFVPGPDLRDDLELSSRLGHIAQTSCHAAGTCKMGNDAMAVVDPRLKVRGLDGLRVVDASIMPAIVSGNTNAVAIMIGEKGADLIRSDQHLMG